MNADQYKAKLAMNRSVNK